MYITYGRVSGWGGLGGGLGGGTSPEATEELQLQQRVIQHVTAKPSINHRALAVLAPSVQTQWQR